MISFRWGLQVSLNVSHNSVFHQINCAPFIFSNSLLHTPLLLYVFYFKYRSYHVNPWKPTWTMVHMTSCILLNFLSAVHRSSDFRWSVHKNFNNDVSVRTFFPKFVCLFRFHWDWFHEIRHAQLIFFQFLLVVSLFYSCCKFSISGY
jgi:hypothetical protein